MTPAQLNTIIEQCVQNVPPPIVHAIVSTESGYNQYAIGIVKGRLSRQPKNLNEAVATSKMLHQKGFNFSLGLGQINKKNLKHYGLNYENVFDPCKNLKVAASILHKCHLRAKKHFKDSNHAMQAAFSCYYSGNFETGFKQDFKGQPSYVQKINLRLLKNRSGTSINKQNSILQEAVPQKKIITNSSSSKLLF